MITRTLFGVAAASAMLLPVAAVAGEPVARGWMTSADGSVKLEPIREIRPAGVTVPVGTVEVRVDIAQRFQAIAGFGASITDASAWLIQNRLTPKARAALLTELFGRNGGMGFNVTRVTIGASDFSRSHYSLADTPGRAEADLTKAPADLIPTLKAIRAVNPRLKIIATPWSAPGWMKDSGSLIRGRLKPERHGDFARYLVSYSRAMARAGVPVDMLTIQNEPHFEPDNYPGMRVEPAQRAQLIGEHLGPLMRVEIPRVKLLDWDHNWDEPASPIAVMSDPKAAQYIAGVAWHCYAGDVKAQSVVRDRFPAKETWFTECASGSWSPAWDQSFAWTVRTLVIGAPRNWAKGVVMWNLALDETGGPHLGGCGNCRGMVTIDSKTGAITREPEYYAFAHASRFVREGAVRVASESSEVLVEAVAFLQPGSRDIAMVLRNGAKEPRHFKIAQGTRDFVVSLPAGAVATFTWKVG